MAFSILSWLCTGIQFSLVVGPKWLVAPPRYISFCSILEGILWPTKTYKIAFWMRKFGSMSFKRTWVWSCSKRICELDMGCLTPSEKNGSLQTTTRYVDKSGKRRFKGNALLKRSQWLVAKLIHILMFPNFAVFGPKLNHYLSVAELFLPNACASPVLQAIHLQVCLQTGATGSQDPQRHHAKQGSDSGGGGCDKIVLNLEHEQLPIKQIKWVVAMRYQKRPFNPSLLKWTSAMNAGRGIWRPILAG